MSATSAIMGTALSIKPILMVNGEGKLVTIDKKRGNKHAIKALIERFDNMPILFTEFGMRSAHACSMNPNNFLWDTRYDGEEQANYMEAVFTTFFDNPYWMGLFWWKWDETQKRPQYHGDPAGDRGFTVQGKPAEAVMRKWMSRNKEK